MYKYSTCVYKFDRLIRKHHCALDVLPFTSSFVCFLKHPVFYLITGPKGGGWGHYPLFLNCGGFHLLLSSLPPPSLMPLDLLHTQKTSLQMVIRRQKQNIILEIAFLHIAEGFASDNLHRTHPTCSVSENNSFLLPSICAIIPSS